MNAQSKFKKPKIDKKSLLPELVSLVKDICNEPELKYDFNLSDDLDVVFDEVVCNLKSFLKDTLKSLKGKYPDDIEMEKHSGDDSGYLLPFHNEIVNLLNEIELSPTEQGNHI